MRQLSLTDDEAVILRDVLEGYLSDLRMEIVSTDMKDFHERLKQQEVVLKKVLAALDPHWEGYYGL